MLQCIAVCRSMLQRIAMSSESIRIISKVATHPWRDCSCKYSVLQYVAVCRSMLQCVAVCRSVSQCVAMSSESIRILSRVATHPGRVCSYNHNALQCVAARCSVLQSVAVCCSLLQCVAVYSNVQ